MKEDTIKGIGHYLEQISNINSEVVIEGLSLIHNHHEVNLLAEKLFSRLGYNSSQLETLEIIYHHKGDITPARLADERTLRRSTMTSILASLERKGYIDRSICKGDRRMVTISLTDKGIKYCKGSLPDRYSRIAKALGAFSPGEKHMLFDAYNAITVFLEKALNEPLKTSG